ncbi:GNAT family N-acetyltransferase [Blastomonas fulva]|uniref:GNAT family N-acetyltransferase n=1 Tax=Blastomonas fulva TaxID=1550728 RepID=UPI0025A3467A|nr:GNAT family N-acetyltransferase [Blastomonas fulva]MDM7930213.1 GNAT family N-acetyltransferase [Blastomonas fulva]MDM7965907.1 GNAT family N-acetyltransferase [Blastomonas fulva]
MTSHFTPVAPGKLATIVTHLDMRARPRPRPLKPVPLRLKRWQAPSADKYRMLYRRVGEPWLWFSRLLLSDDALTAIVHHPAVEIFAVRDPQGIEVGLLELDFRQSGACEIAFFGLIPQLTGQGFGGWLMAQALTLAWRAGVERVWVHTCTLDDPRAPGFYIAQGFVPIAREIEVMDDPRLTGLIPREAAPHVPLI